jgi:hypothetical protein
MHVAAQGVSKSTMVKGAKLLLSSFLPCRYYLWAWINSYFLSPRGVKMKAVWSGAWLPLTQG